MIRMPFDQIQADIDSFSYVDQPWADLTLADPRLRNLDFDAHHHRRPWGEITADLRRLVGWKSTIPALRTASACRVAYRRICASWEWGDECQ